MNLKSYSLFNFLYCITKWEYLDQHNVTGRTIYSACSLKDRREANLCFTPCPFKSSHIERVHIFMVLGLVVTGQVGEDGVVCDRWPKLTIQPVRENILGGLHQILPNKEHMSQGKVT